jgi:multiple antibiotic resistance protein
VSATVGTGLVATGIGLFTIVNPVGNLPIFLALTEDEAGPERRRTAIQVALAFTVLLLASLFAGEAVLELFGIRIDAFRMAGYAVLVALGWSMVGGRAGAAFAPAREGEGVAVVPLAFPLLAGPGAISFVISYADHADTALDYALGAAVILVVAAITLAALALGPAITRRLGAGGMDILTRFFGLLLLAIVIGGIFEVLGEALPGLAASAA